MAHIRAPRFFTTRQTASGARYLWQPPSRHAGLGWKSVALANQGEASPAAIAMLQAQWLNAIYDLVTASNTAGAQLLVQAWAAGGSGQACGFSSLAACPFIPYKVPGIGTPKPQRQGKASLSRLMELYRKAPEFKNLRHREQLDRAGIMAGFEAMLGAERVPDLRRRRLRLVYEALIRKHGNASAVWRMRALSAVLSYGVELEWLEANPMHRFKFLAVPGRIRVPSEAEIAALRQAARDLPGGFRPEAELLILIAMFTGQRRGDVIEAMSLKQFREGLFAFTQSKRGAFVRVPLLAELVEQGSAAIAATEAVLGNLDQRFAELKLKKGRKWWFRDIRETPLLWNSKRRIPLDKHSASRLFREVREQAALTLASCASLKLMDFRDYFITECFRAGMTDAEVAALAGHSEGSVAMKRKHYVDRHDPVIMANAITKLNTRRAAAKEA